MSGLTTAVALLEAGWQTEIVTRQTFESAVSSVAAAVWTITAAEPVDDVRRWALTSRTRFEAISTDPTSGVVTLRQWELEREPVEPSWWCGTPFARPIPDGELPPGFRSGVEVDGFMVEPPVYLRWLNERMADLGGGLTIGEVARLADLGGDLVVNCSGLGAGSLADDPTVHPIRGQVVAVENPGIHDAIADESDPECISYVYPRSNEIVLGGCREIGSDDMAEDPALTERILADASQLDPRVDGLRVVAVRVGLRPGRPSVRVERESLPDGRGLIHDYGHGGSGFILSWGCAEEVVRLAGRPTP